MIRFTSQTNFKLKKAGLYRTWIKGVILKESFDLGELNFLFCDDPHIHKLNLEFLKHDTFTDILTFESSLGKTVNADVCISVDRVRENAKEQQVTFYNELSRVLVHGVLHLCGYNDSSEPEKAVMRSKENEYLAQFFSE